MQRIFAVFFLLLMALVSFEELGIYIGFKLNQTYIAENLCVERDIEESTCRGCCQLNEKLEENRKEAPMAPVESNTKVQFKLVYLESKKLKHDLIPSYKASIFETYNRNFYRFVFVKDCFHPPQFA